MATEKYERFMHALEALCKEHGVQIAVTGYDGIQIWDLREGEDFIFSEGIVDRIGVEDGRNSHDV